MSGSNISVPEYPPQKSVRIGGFEIRYFVAGPTDGRPLLLCHGLAASGRQFVEDAAFFATKGFRVIVPDLRGHGNSICPEERADANFTIKRLAADLIAILDAEDVETIDWVGNSLGGILALSLMGTDRSRLGKVVCFGTSFALKFSKLWVPVIGLAHTVMGGDLMAKVGAPMTTRHPKARALVKSMLGGMDIDAVQRTGLALCDYDLTDNAMAFDGSLLVIRGARDGPVNRALRPTLKVLGGKDNFQLIEMDEAGHVANLDQPEKVRASILEFLG